MGEASVEQGPSGGVTPHLTIGAEGGGAAAAIDFYRAAFGAEELDRRLADDGRRLIHAHLRVNGASLMLNDAFPEYGHSGAPPAGFTLHLQVDDADAWFARATAAGAEVTMPLALQFWGDRYGQLRDPFGVSWSIGAGAGSSA